MKIKLLTGGCMNELEDAVNECLEESKDKIKVIDIKYNYQECYAPARDFWGRPFWCQHHNFTAMIIYERKNERCHK